MLITNTIPIMALINNKDVDNDVTRSLREYYI